MGKANDLGENEVELPDDPRLGKRVFCLTFLPETIYGTLKRITIFVDCPERETWNVLTEHGVIVEAPAASFLLYPYPTEFHLGDQVRRYVDEGGYWDLVILKALYTFDCLGFLVRVENGELSAVPLKTGAVFVDYPERLHPRERMS